VLLFHAVPHGHRRRTGESADIASGAKRAPGARDQQRAHAVIVAHLGDDAFHLFACVLIKGILLLGKIESHPTNAFRAAVEQWHRFLLPGMG
jgi:hypothetical protein